MVLGYRGNPTWRDMSEFVCHFTKEAPPRSAYDVMIRILGSRQLLAGNPFGAAKNLSATIAGQSAVCFSEIPLDRLDRLISRRSMYGIGFRQDDLAAAGAGRVWYVEKDSAGAGAVNALMYPTGYPRPAPSDNPIWKLTPFIDFPGDYGAGSYRFEWEREWRLPGNLRFSEEQVAFLFIPEQFHGPARTFFRQAREENIGPSFECPFIDPTWSESKIQAVLVSG